MWNLSTDYTSELAQRFLLEDFMKVVLRTRRLYVETPPPPDIGHGFYEPVILCLCWCDFLGALYCGDGKMGPGRSTARSKKFIEAAMGQLNSIYRSVSHRLVKTYRNGPVHAFVPDGNFDIHILDEAEHLKVLTTPDCLVISVKALLDDLEKSVRWYANNLKDTGDSSEGSIGALNKARKELLKYTTRP